MSGWAPKTVGVGLLLVTMHIPVPVAQVSAQALGAEAYFYQQVPVPAYLVADEFIDAIVLPTLPSVLGPLWSTVRDQSEPLDVSMDAFFSSGSVASPSPDERQAHLSTLFLLKQLRDAIVIYEQLALSPESYAARFGEPGFPLAGQRAAYMTRANTFLGQGDTPQQAALKASVAILHDRDRQDGMPVMECHFENPQTRQQAFCRLELSQMDGVYRDVTLARMFPLDEEAVRSLASSSGASADMIRSRASIIDVLSADLLHGEDFRLHRLSAIQRALEQQEGYQSALAQREAERPPPPPRPAPTAQLSGLFDVLAAGMATILVVAQAEQSARASRYAGDPKWRGHENDEWCYIEYDYYRSGNNPILQTQMNTYCTTYNGFLRSANGILDRCGGVEGWCKGE